MIGPAKINIDGFVEKTIIKMVNESATMREIAVFLTDKGYAHTRSAVAGKIKRLRDKKLIPPGIKILESSPTVKTVKLDKKFIPNRPIKGASIKAKREKHNAVPVENSTGAGIPFLKVKDSQCKWILDYQRNGQKMCCGDKMYHRSFCEKHYFMCYEAPINRRARVNPRVVDRDVHDSTHIMYNRFLRIFK
jgi:hypothetical protein